MQPKDRIFVAGHRGLVGSAIVRRLEAAGLRNLLLRSSQDLDLREQGPVRDFFASERPRFVFLSAAKVGGILANDSHPADFIGDNLQIQTNVIDAAYRSGVDKLVFLGSSCIYPREAPQPIREESLLEGALEPTNQWYATAKIAGIKMCAAYRRQYGFDAVSLMPTNLYGPNDNFDLTSSHVIPALIRKFHEAKVRGCASVELWGTGTPMREFMHVDDLADACVFCMNAYDEEQILNVGVGKETSIAELAQRIGEIVGFCGEIRFDRSKPDGTPRKVLDVSRLNQIGWRATIGLGDGLRSTYAWFKESVEGKE